MYIDEVYIDTTRARVFLSDSSTWAAIDSTKEKDIQIPTAWSSGSVTVDCNIPSFTSGNLYMYVINADGEVNENGFEVTI